MRSTPSALSSPWSRCAAGAAGCSGRTRDCPGCRPRRTCRPPTPRASTPAAVSWRGRISRRGAARRAPSSGSRSEERRVGKECRHGWGQDDDQEKKKAHANEECILPAQPRDRVTKHFVRVLFRSLLGLFFFFFQAEDGIRDTSVTGVQTCALPILPPSPNMPTADTARVYPGGCLVEGTNLSEGRGTTRPFEWIEIGRASCRERV